MFYYLIVTGDFVVVVIERIRKKMKEKKNNLLFTCNRCLGTNSFFLLVCYVFCYFLLFFFPKELFVC